MTYNKPMLSTDLNFEHKKEKGFLTLNETIDLLGAKVTNSPLNEKLSLSLAIADLIFDFSKKDSTEITIKRMENK